MILQNNLAKSITSLLIFIGPLISIAQSPVVALPGSRSSNIAAVDSIVRKLIDTAGVTGMAIGIIHNNEPAYMKAYGYRNKSLSLPNDTNTSFYAASLAKALFATVVMQLVDKGQIDLDKPLYSYLPKPLPEYENYKDLSGDDRWKLITGRHCLEHSTGFPNWRQLNPTGSNKLQIFFTPGSRYAYSGEGIYLLQFVVEIITGQSLEALARKQIFEPFGMTNTSYVWQPSFEKNYAVGHSVDEDTFSIHRRSSPNAAGSMQTTITDYTRFLSCVMQGKGISEKSQREMISPQIAISSAHQFPSLQNDNSSVYKSIGLSYGLGWGIFQCNLGKAFFKEGHSDDGWVHYAVSFPDDKSALIIMTNSMNGESIFKELVEKLTTVTIPWQWEGYTPYRSTVKIPASLLNKYVGTYNGRLKAHVSFEDGFLKASSVDVGLKPTRLYPSSNTQFFMKAMDLSCEFADELNGQPQSLKVADEGENYILKRIKDSTIKFTPSKETLLSYTGNYSFATDPKRILSIEFYEGQLLAKTKGQPAMLFVFESNTSFKVQSVLDIKGRFILDNGVVTKMIIAQNGEYEWKKLP